MAAIKRKRVLVEVNLTLKGESDVGDKHAYFMCGQDHSGGPGNTANAAFNRNAYPNRARGSRGNLVETLSHRHIGVVGDEFAVSSDGMEMFGVLDLEAGFEGCRFAIGIRNANNKRFRLACTVGLRVFVCYNLAFRGDYTPVLAKHSKHFSLDDALSIGVDRMQRNFEPMRQQVERWRAQQLSGEVARLTMYRAFIEGELEVPKHLARRVHDLYFNPQHEEFAPRTMWSLSNAFTSAFKELDPIPQFKATAKLGEFLESRFSQSF
jgi:hypothetical protein